MKARLVGATPLGEEERAGEEREEGVMGKKRGRLETGRSLRTKVEIWRRETKEEARLPLHIVYTHCLTLPRSSSLLSGRRL